MAHNSKSDCSAQNGITRCIDQPNVRADVLTRGGAQPSVAMKDEETLTVSVGWQSQDECSVSPCACTLNLRTGILEAPDKMAGFLRVLRAGGVAERISMPRTLLADGDAVWLVCANDHNHTQSMLDALSADHDAGFEAIETAAFACGAAAFAAVCLTLPGAYQSIRVPSELSQGERAADYVSEQIEAADCPPKLAIAFMTCMDELFSNIVFYSGSQDAEVGCSIAGGYVSVRLTDRGKPFNPNDVKQPDVSLSAEERKIGGLGVFMVKKLMDSFEYEYRAGQNIVIIRKRIPV